MAEICTVFVYFVSFYLTVRSAYMICLWYNVCDCHAIIKGNLLTYLYYLTTLDSILTQQYRCQKLAKSVDVHWSYSVQRQCRFFETQCINLSSHLHMHTHARRHHTSQPRDLDLYPFDLRFDACQGFAVEYTCIPSMVQIAQVAFLLQRVHTHTATHIHK